MTSPNPARSPVAPPSGKIICSLRAPELSATSSMLLIITVIASVSRPAATERLPFRPESPAAARCASGFPSAASASASTWAASLPVAQNPPHALHSSRRARRTSWFSTPPGHRRDAPFCAPPGPRWSCSFCSRPQRLSLPCAGPRLVHLSPPLLLLRCSACGRAPAGNRFHPRNVLAQPAHLLQALRLPHIELELQLEELIVELPLLMAKLVVGWVADLFGFHKISSQFPLVSSHLQCAISRLTNLVPRS